MNFSFWQMFKGRLVAWLMAVIVTWLAGTGLVEMTEETTGMIEQLVTALVGLVGLLVYSAVHTLITKRKLDKGQIATENIANPRSVS